MSTDLSIPPVPSYSAEPRTRPDDLPATEPWPSLRDVTAEDLLDTYVTLVLGELAVELPPGDRTVLLTHFITDGSRLHRPITPPHVNAACKRAVEATLRTYAGAAFTERYLEGVHIQPTEVYEVFTRVLQAYHVVFGRGLDALSKGSRS